MRNYNHLNLDNRDVIQNLLYLGVLQKDIAKAVGKDPSTISREKKRNTINQKYISHKAQNLTNLRHTKANIERGKIYNDKLYDKFIFYLTKFQLSPDEISGRLKKEYRNQPKMRISHETGYKIIFKLKEQGNTINKNLRHKNKKNSKRGRKRNNPFKNQADKKRSIHDRPKIIEKNIQFGNWEGDIVEGAKNSGYFGTFVERKSKFLIAFKIDSKHSDTFAEKIKEYFADLDNSKIKTLTLDNGSENARFENIEEFLNCKVYFCDPHSPWQKGLNENTNGLLRQYFPKGTDFSTITQKELDEVIFLLNNRPRKILGYRTPYEVFFKKTIQKIALRI